MLQLSPDLAQVLTETVETVGSDIVASAPTVLRGLVFLVASGVAVTLLLRGLRRLLNRVAPTDADGDGLPDGARAAYQNLAVRTLGVFLWFGVFLTFLSMVGFEELAAALGTATGFLALGVSYALKDMVADAVAGVYLLRDHDFMPGDTVTVDGITGEILAIELRKTRLRVDGDIEVRANNKIEGKWRKHTVADER
jgi:small-conductance mechanosensitive channel